MAPVVAGAARDGQRGGLGPGLTRGVFQITTSHMGTRDIILVAANTGEITVDGSVQGGHVQNRIHRDAFIRAVLIR